jgi:vacuolar-type H+-ATPase subunit D/Vma8
MEFKKTRSDILKLIKLKSLVLYGEAILKKKNILLTSTLVSSLLNYKKNLDSANVLIKEAVRQSDFALSIDGVQGVLSASNMITSSYSLDFKNENLIGTFIPSFLFKDFSTKRNYGTISTSVRIEETSLIFSRLINELVSEADLYLRIKKLSHAIFRTKARYNSLEKKLLPSLLKQQVAITEFLENTEQRENFTIRNLIEV